jgi:hypothetical protein
MFRHPRRDIDLAVDLDVMSVMLCHCFMSLVVCFRRRGINLAVDHVVSQLKTRAKMISTTEEISQVSERRSVRDGALVEVTLVSAERCSCVGRRKDALSADRTGVAAGAAGLNQLQLSKAFKQPILDTPHQHQPASSGMQPAGGCNVLTAKLRCITISATTQCLHALLNTVRCTTVITPAGISESRASHISSFTHILYLIPFP